MYPDGPQAMPPELGRGVKRMSKRSDQLAYPIVSYEDAKAEDRVAARGACSAPRC